MLQISQPETRDVSTDAFLPSMHPRAPQTRRVQPERGAGVEQHGAAHGLARLVFFEGGVRPAAAFAAAQTRAYRGLAQGGDARAASGHDFGRGGLGDGRFPQRGRGRGLRGGAVGAVGAAGAVGGWGRVGHVGRWGAAGPATGRG